MTEPLHLKNHDRAGLRDQLAARGIEPYRGNQIFRWIWRRGASSVEAMTDLSKDLRGRLLEEATLRELTLTEVREASDGTLKLLVGLPDGRQVESVMIPDGERRTLCVSTQVGCAMGCTFCRTATMGLIRHLEPWEIVEQVRLAEEVLAERGEVRILQLGRGQGGQVQRRLTNLVFMGMGEPLHNLEGTVTACSVLTDPTGLAFPHRRITVSTVGLAEAIPGFLERTNVQLAVSLNAPNDAIRGQIMPVNRKFDMAKLQQVIQSLELGHRRRVTFEYVLLAGVNDQPAHVDDLLRFLRPILDKVKINLIPFNPHEGAEFGRPSAEAVDAFQQRLYRGGVDTIHVRRPRGDDVLAACGQLAVQRASG